MLNASLVQYGTADDIRKAVAAGADLESRDDYHRTPLMIAVESGNLETATALLDAGADVEASDDDAERWTERMASKIGTGMAAAIVEMLRDTRAKARGPKPRWTLGRTPLHLAVEHGNVAMTLLLLDRGADATAQGGGNATLPETIVEKAVRCSQGDVLDALLERPWPNLGELGLDTALRRAARSKELAFVRRLLRAGADPQGRDAYGRPLLSHLLEHFQGDHDAWHVVRELVEAGAGSRNDLLPDLVGFMSSPTALPMLRMLVDAGADVDARSPDGGFTALSSVAHSGSRFALQCLLEYGADTEIGDERSETALMAAQAMTDSSHRDPWTSLRILLDGGADPNAATRSDDLWGGRTAIMLADARRAEYLLLNGADPDARWSDGEQTALMRAVVREPPAVIRMLVAAGADVNATTRAPAAGAPGSSTHPLAFTEAGRTALMIAASSMRLDNVCALLEAGADVRARSDGGVTALMTADRVARDPHMVRRLLAAGADPTDLDAPSPVVLQHGVEVRETPPLASPAGVLRHGTSADEIFRAIDSLTGPLDRDELMRDVLWTVVRAGNAAGVRSLLEAGVDPNPDGPDTSALHAAVARVDVASVESLLDAGADPNVWDRFGVRPLDLVDSDWHDHPAPRGRSTALIRMLLEAGAAYAPDLNGYRRGSLVHWYRSSDHDGSLEPAWVQELAPWIDDVDLELRACDPSPLMLAAANGDLHTARLVLGMGADPDGRPQGHAGPLELGAAASLCAGPMVRLLVDAGASVDGDDGAAALSSAARAGKVDAIRTLLSFGVGPDARLDGDTALMRAAATGGRAAVATLLAAGADPNAAGLRHGWTPLMWAARHAHDAGVVARLIEAGADVDACTPPFEERSGLDPAYREVLRDTRPRERLAMGLSPGFTALMAAETRTPSKRGTADVVDALLAAGSDARRARSDSVRVAEPAAAPPLPRSRTTSPSGDALTLALIQAARRNDLDGARRLIAAGAVGERGSHDWGTTALLSAFERGHLAAVHLLLDAGADIEARDRQGFTLLARVARAPREPTTDRATADLLERLLQQGADREARTAAGWTPLMLAACHDRSAAASALIRAGAAVDARGGPWGVTALMVAARWGLRADVIEALLGAGCDLEARTTASHTPRSTSAPATLRRMHPSAPPAPGETVAGRTALMHAAARRFRRRTTEALDALLAAGADVHALTDLGHTALQFATAIDPGSATVRRLRSAGARSPR